MSTGSFALSPLTPMRMRGLGMIIALVVDATLVRMFLVPATVRLLGAANWGSPFTRTDREPLRLRSPGSVRIPDVRPRTLPESERVARRRTLAVVRNRLYARGLYRPL